MTNYSHFKLEIFIPASHVDALREALGQVGAGRIGNYDQCCSVMDVRGYWRPLRAAGPTLSKEWDLTEAQELTLSQGSLDLVGNLQEPIQIVGLYASDQRGTQDQVENLLLKDPNSRVVMGAQSDGLRTSESQKLLNWGFQAFDALRLFDNSKPMATVPVWKGKAKEARLGAAHAVFVTVPRGEGANLQTRIERTDPLVAPLNAGQRVGRLLVTTSAGTKVAEVPLVVMEGVEPAGIFGRAWDAIRLWIK